MRASSADHPTVDAQHDQVLDLLRDAHDNTLSIDALHQAGVRNPASMVYELELRGYVIHHVTHPRAGRGAEYRLDGIVDDAELGQEPRPDAL